MSILVLQSSRVPKQSNTIFSNHYQQYQVTDKTLTGTKVAFTRDHPITLHKLTVAIYTESAISPTNIFLCNENNETCDGIASGHVILKLIIRGGHHSAYILCCCGCGCS